MKDLRRFSFIKPRYIIIFGLVISLVMIISSYIEFIENKHEIYHMLDEHANSIIYSIDKSSKNTVIADMEIENLLTTHLLGVAYNVARLDSVSGLSHNLLVRIAEENDVYRINVFNNKVEKEFSNFVPNSVYHQEPSKYSPHDFIDSVISGNKKEIIIGLKSARMEKGMRYAVAVARAYKKGAIVVNLDAESFLEFRRKIGFEKTITDIGKKSGIEYITLQDEKEIIASSKKLSGLSGLNEDSFLKDALLKDSAVSRINKFEEKNIYEIVKPFIVEGEKIGLFRVGLSMEEINQLESKMLWRGLILSLVIIVIILIVIAVIVSNQNYKMVSEEFNKIQTFTGEILANMTQAVITINNKNEIEIFNKKAEEIFGIKQSFASGKNFNEIFGTCREIIDIIQNKKIVKNMEISCSAGGREGYIFNINTNIIKDSEDKITAFNIVIDDVTETRNFEKQNQLNEKLIAMGELASGVAHEVRNPLNSINMIAQRFEKEYSNEIKSEDFNTLSNVLKTESSRVNNIIEQFLRFARPPKLNISVISSVGFMNQIKSICEISAKEKNVNISVNAETDFLLSVDTEQMKQVLINLFQNALDAVGTDGKIIINLKNKNKKNIFEVSDNGEGIPEENLNKIFNLYFTTKTGGTGLGLSIVQQIISRHGGNIRVESGNGPGTKFTIELPNKKL